jgi:peptide-methionine (S)-S-oxide reductase
LPAGCAGADYEKVSTGTTGNAEAVRITFDPTQVSYAELLRIFFSVAQPEVNRQGRMSAQYRSAIFPQSPAQVKSPGLYRPAATGSCVQTADRRGLKAADYRGRSYHQDFMRRTRTIPTSSSTTGRRSPR